MTNIIIYKEKAFITDTPIDFDLSSSGNLYWDNRFEIIFNKSGCNISTLKMDEYIKLKQHLSLEKLAKDSNNNHNSNQYSIKNGVKNFNNLK